MAVPRVFNREHIARHCRSMRHLHGLGVHWLKSDDDYVALAQNFTESEPYWTCVVCGFGYVRSFPVLQWWSETFVIV